jgi:hypothetical protein
MLTTRIQAVQILPVLEKNFDYIRGTLVVAIRIYGNLSSDVTIFRLR